MLKIFFDKMTSMRTYIIFSCIIIYSWIAHFMRQSTPVTDCDELIKYLQQLLMEQFDTLPIQCRHIEHMHEGD